MTPEETRSEVFREHRPEISDADMIEAAQAGRFVLSLNTAPVCMTDGTISAVGIKWKLQDGTTQTIIVDRYPATILRGLFDHLDQNNWTGTALIPPDARPQ
jgi:hypothetical protein